MRSAEVAVHDMTIQLGRAGWAVLDGMFDREVMLARLREGDLGWRKRELSDVFFARAEALMLMEAGPSKALDAKLAFALELVTPAQREHAERFDAWVRSQAGAA